MINFQQRYETIPAIFIVHFLLSLQQKKEKDEFFIFLHHYVPLRRCVCVDIHAKLKREGEKGQRTYHWLVSVATGAIP